MDEVVKLRIEEYESRALKIEGDSDNPLRVAAANRWWNKAQALRKSLDRIKDQSHDD